MANSPFLRFEYFVRRLVEQPFAWLSGDAVDPFGMANHLLQLLRESQQQGTPIAQFTISMNPDHFEPGQPNPQQLADLVSAYMVLLAERTGQTLAEPPLILIEQDPAVDLRLATVVATENVAVAPANTEIFQHDPVDSASEAIRELDAYLIVQGRKHVPLDRPVTRIGRRTDNDIVLDSPSVSRHHAQIRWRDAYFVLFDTSSHGRTLVNGEPVEEQVLRPGDVIALSDVLLIYGEERQAGESGQSETAPASSTMLKPSE
jgi:hypothetical protein